MEDLSFWSDLIPWGMFALEEESSAAPMAEELLGWESSPAPAVQGSAFRRYGRERRRVGGGGGGRVNIHRRMIEYLRRMPVQKREKEAECSRSMRHMMRERQRRERLSQSYADLYHMIQPQPKTDKNSIVLAAASYVRGLTRTRDALHRRHQELRSAAAARGDERTEGATIRFRVGNPSSPVDSMIAASRGSRAWTSRPGPSAPSPATMTTNEVETTVQQALVEVEWKLRNCPKSTKMFRVGPPDVGR
ncbi:unnamed protein product [Spirodela intermedia]|uniref:BHLH domain-containing protein n=1 Tax=Spirodela intermedia TaxID=51605 RepID=A0A7I8I801_SPIIN|nr:unnamed protein product [Spirodela intermedia]CAA6653690.1 unnamed protein product [Spirodela intermedia]